MKVLSIVASGFNDGFLMKYKRFGDIKIIKKGSA